MFKAALSPVTRDENFFMHKSSQKNISLQFFLELHNFIMYTVDKTIKFRIQL